MIANTIEARLGNIVEYEGDAVVNAASTSLLGGAGVDGAIHSKAGPDLLEECRGIGGCPTGESRVTLGYNLKTKYIIHTVGPIWTGGYSGEKTLLASCYFSCLKSAKKLNIGKIAFPAISCGVYGYPPDKAAYVAVDSLNIFSEKLQLRCEFTIMCFSHDMLALYQEILN